MHEISNAIQSITESTQDTADVSSKIMASLNEVTVVVNEVGEMSQAQNGVAEDLNGIVQKFHIES